MKQEIVSPHMGNIYIPYPHRRAAQSQESKQALKADRDEIAQLRAEINTLKAEVQTLKGKP